MSMPVNTGAYRELIQQDLDWLRSMPRTLERDHIEAILWFHMGCGPEIGEYIRELKGVVNVLADRLSRLTGHPIPREIREAEQHVRQMDQP